MYRFSKDKKRGQHLMAFFLYITPLFMLFIVPPLVFTLVKSLTFAVLLLWTFITVAPRQIGHECEKKLEREKERGASINRMKKVWNVDVAECMAMNRTALSRRDGPDQTSPQLGQFSGSSPQEAVSSMSNHILLKFHSDFSTSGFFVLRYHGEHLFSGLRIHEGLILK